MILIRNGESHQEWFYNLELRWTHHVSGSFANYLKRFLIKIEGKYAAIKITRYIYIFWYYWNIFALVKWLLNGKSEKLTKSNFVRGNPDYPLFFLFFDSRKRFSTKSETFFSFSTCIFLFFRRQTLHTITTKLFKNY